MRRYLVLCCAMLAMISCAPHAGLEGGPVGEKPGSHFAPHYEGSIFKVTDKKLYSVELLFKAGKFSVGANSMDMVIHRDTADNPDVEHAQIVVTPWMPAHDHGVQSVPKITERGAGLYSVENLEASMEGDWQLRISIDSLHGKDSVLVDFPDVRKEKAVGHKMMHQGGHAGAMEKMANIHPPADADFSLARKSQRGIYTVTYEESKAMPVPLNRIHSWLLTVQDSMGQPVSGLHVQVDGDMPAHGHGMPTRPRVTREVAPGAYLVEGMKFTMPGWWTVTFYLRAGQDTDAVTFNLNIR